MWRALLALTLSLAFVGAAPDASAEKRFPILRWLVREKVLTAKAYAPIRRAQASIDACLSDARAGAKNARSCVPARKERMRLQLALFSRALAKLEPLEEPTKLEKLLILKCKRSMTELRQRLAALEKEREP